MTQMSREAARAPLPELALEPVKGLVGLSCEIPEPRFLATTPGHPQCRKEHSGGLIPVLEKKTNLQRMLFKSSFLGGEGMDTETGKELHSTCQGFQIEDRRLSPVLFRNV